LPVAHKAETGSPIRSRWIVPIEAVNLSPALTAQVRLARGRRGGEVAGAPAPARRGGIGDTV